MSTHRELFEQWKEWNRYATASLFLLKNQLQSLLAGRTRKLSPRNEAQAKELDEVIYRTRLAVLALQERLEAELDKMTPADRAALAELNTESEQIHEQWSGLMRQAATALGRE